MQILDASKNNNQFDGVTVKGSLPELFHGMDFAYFIQDDRFCKAEPDFMEKAKPLSDLSRNGQFHFQMGRNTLSNFYHNVLPQLQDIADITEENPEKFRQYLTPEAHFVFYLDMEDDNITCKISSFTVKKSIPYARPFSTTAFARSNNSVIFLWKTVFLDRQWNGCLIMMPTLTSCTVPEKRIWFII